MFSLEAIFTILPNGYGLARDVSLTYQIVKKLRLPKLSAQFIVGCLRYVNGILNFANSNAAAMCELFL